MACLGEVAGEMLWVDMISRVSVKMLVWMKCKREVFTSEAAAVPSARPAWSKASRCQFVGEEKPWVDSRVDPIDKEVSIGNEFCYHSKRKRARKRDYIPRSLNLLVFPTANWLAGTWKQRFQVLRVN